MRVIFECRNPLLCMNKKGRTCRLIKEDWIVSCPYLWKVRI